MDGSANSWTHALPPPDLHGALISEFSEQYSEQAEGDGKVNM